MNKAMNKNNFPIRAAFAFMAFVFNGELSLAHTGENDGPREYAPVMTEFGSYDPAYQVERTVEVTMRDAMTFEPETIEVRAGEVALLKVTNAGKLMHEFVIGTDDSLREHAELMKKFPTMEHDEPYMAHVPPGETMEIVWKFDKTGSFEFACLIPGHYDAGMKGDLMVK